MRSRIVSWLLGLCCAVLLLVIYMFLLLFLSISIEIKWVLLQNSSRPHQDEIFINNFAAIVPNALTYCSVCIVVIVCTFSDLIFCIISHLVRSFLGKTFFFQFSIVKGCLQSFGWSWTHLGFIIPLPTLTHSKRLLWSFYFLQSVCYVPTMIHNNNNPTVSDTLEQIQINSCRSDAKSFKNIYITS